MSEPTLDQRTPNLRLKYEADDARNYNWAKIDDLFSQGFTALTGAWIGTPQTTLLGLNAPPVELAHVTTDANENATRTSLVVAQATLRIQFGASASAPNGTVTATIQRGTTDVQSRSFIYDASSIADDGLDLDIPYTFVRLAPPGDTSAIWRLTASLTQVGGGTPIDVVRTFAQMYAVQFR